jgi:hypothetical protein
MEGFEITVNGITYTGELLAYGYSYKIVMLINDVPVSFEPDEERNFRAIVPLTEMDKIDKQLLAAIGEELEKSLK